MSNLDVYDLPTLDDSLTQYISIDPIPFALRKVRFFLSNVLRGMSLFLPLRTNINQSSIVSKSETQPQTNHTNHTLLQREIKRANVQYPAMKTIPQMLIGILSIMKLFHYNFTFGITSSDIEVLIYSLLILYYIVVDLLHNWLIMNMNFSILIHHLVMLLLPWYYLIFQEPQPFEYIGYILGSTEIWTVAFYIFRKSPYNDLYKRCAHVGLWLRTLSMVEVLRVMVYTNTFRPIIILLFCIIMGSNQYYTKLFMKKIQFIEILLARSERDALFSG